MNLSQGDRYCFDLNPSKCTETKKGRPCLIVSNDNYNRFLNTVLVAPISSSDKYLNQNKYLESPLFFKIQSDNVHGTVLLQHIRAVDPNIRITSGKLGSISKYDLESIQLVLKKFF